MHGHLGPGEVAPLTLMGGEVDVRKLRSSLELWRKVTPAEDAVRRGLADNILKALG